MSTNVFVWTAGRKGEAGAWTRYNFPFNIDNFALMNEDLYIRAGDEILLYTKDSLLDYANNDAKQQQFTSIVQWPWLDLGTPGANKILSGLDLVSDSGAPSVQIGYDQSNPSSAYTTPYFVAPDTVPGTFIPITVMAPSFSLRVTFNSTDNWSLYAANLYVREQRPTAGP